MKSFCSRSRKPAFGVIVGLFALTFLGPIPAFHRDLIAQQKSVEEATRTLSPYFLIKRGDEALDQLPLKRTSAEVRIGGVVADVVVEQVYENTGKRAIEAVYVFPASTRAAVHGMTMTIGERLISAVIKEREQARADYVLCLGRRAG